MSQNGMPEVTAYISTKDRYFSTLPLAIMSIANQTLKPKYFILYDDGAQEDLRKENLYDNIFKCLDEKGIGWEVKFGWRVGQATNHDRVIDESKTEFIWRLDDDNVAEPDTLEKLVRNFKDEKVGGVASLVYHPGGLQERPWFASSKIEDSFDLPTIQWFKQPEHVEEVDHFYSTFVYRKSAAGHRYQHKNLSPVGHREETMFSYEMKRAGWKLLVDTSAITWHFRAPTGGIRSGTSFDMWDHDDKFYMSKLKEWDVKIRHPKLCVLDCGLGDHLVFSKIWPEIKEKYKDQLIILAVCYPEVFKDEKDIKIVSIGEAMMLGNIEELNIYKKMMDWDWKDSLENAFRKLYGV